MTARHAVQTRREAAQYVGEHVVGKHLRRIVQVAFHVVVVRYRALDIGNGLLSRSLWIGWDCARSLCLLRFFFFEILFITY